MTGLLKYTQSILDLRKEQNYFRFLKDKKKNDLSKSFLIDFSSNDYLGLSQHPLLKQRAIEYVQKYGCGSKSSRLLATDLHFYSPVEQKISLLKGKESSLILNCGYQANLSLLSSLVNKQSLVFADRLCHHSLLMGAKLGGARLLRYRHNDYHHLKYLMNKHKGGSSTCIVTESTFGMDGDCANLEELIKIKKEFHSFLYVDEAHSTGILGKKGRGLAADQEDIDIVMGTFGKALGSFGAYLSCSQKLKDYFINCCGGFIYTTALPPSVLGSIDAAIDLLPSLEKQREKILKNASWLRQALHKEGWNCGQSSTHIIPIIVGENKQALNIENELKKRGIITTAIRQPTVPAKQARIRIALSSEHTKDHLKTLLQKLEDCKNKL